MRREATELVPGHDVRRGLGGDSLGAVAGKGFAANKTKADAVAVAEEADVRSQMPADFGQRFVAASGSDTIRLGIENLFQILAPALPFGYFQTGAQFRFDFIK